MLNYIKLIVIGIVLLLLLLGGYKIFQAYSEINKLSIENNELINTNKDNSLVLDQVIISKEENNNSTIKTIDILNDNNNSKDVISKVEEKYSHEVVEEDVPETKVVKETDSSKTVKQVKPTVKVIKPVKNNLEKNSVAALIELSNSLDAKFSNLPDIQ